MLNYSIIKKVPTVYLLIILLVNCSPTDKGSPTFELNEMDYFQNTGVNVLVFNHWYNGLFGDEKNSGIEIIHHGVRTVTNGDVRIDNTPEQWNEIPTFNEKKVDSVNHVIEAFLSYPAYDFSYSIKVEPLLEGLKITVNLDKPLPGILEGRAGMNMEFLPSAYFEKSYTMDGAPGIFPLYPSSNMEFDIHGNTTPKPLSKGYKIVLAPEDDERRISIDGHGSDIMLFDGRDKAQNGWFVLRSLIPAGKTGPVIEWTLAANSISDWVRKPVVAYSQTGYHPEQKKVAVIELDKNDLPENKKATLFRHDANGKKNIIQESIPEKWGDYLRYQYRTFDFSDIKESGIYSIAYDGQLTASFPITSDHLTSAWYPTNDIYLPAQMDHMFVNEAYRVWHGKSHMDDALQAPVGIEHFDLYAQGPTTDTPYQPGEHIPGLNVGGWYDAGDYDIRTQTQYATVLTLVHAIEDFDVTRDETYIDQDIQYVDMHHPDGKNDILQQIEHGTLALIGQYKAVGHAIPGIIVPSISQYTHLGDGLTMTDNHIYDPSLDSLEVRGNYSGTFDDRWAFTSKSTSLDYGSIATLAAASRVLKNHNKKLAEECLMWAKKVWEDEHSREPVIFRHGNTTGGRLENEELKAAIELYLTTRDDKYKDRLIELWPIVENSFRFSASHILRMLPFLEDLEKEKLKDLAVSYKSWADSIYLQNPYGVPVTRGGWAGNGTVIRFGINNYALYEAYPEVFDKEDVLKCLNYLYGCHPGSNISFVSAVGTQSKKVAYGMNRADYSFIAGGIVPGVVILPPDFPENKEDWPFLWGENEYVVNMGAVYIYLVNAGIEILK